MTRYRTQSANVLNAADDFERRLAYSLFVQEQDARLWSGYDWSPGDPLFPDPRLVFNGGTCSCCNDIDDDEPYQGNVVRRMVELFNDGDNYPSIRCKDCEVWWRGPDPCFVCGELVEVSLRNQPLFDGLHMPIGEITNFSMEPDGLSIQAQMYAMMDVEYSRAINRAFAGVRASFETSWFDAFQGIRNSSGFSFVNTATPQAEEPVSCEDVDLSFDVERLYEPVVGVYRLLELPENLDLSAQRPVEPPLVDFRQFTPEPETEYVRYYLDRPITERRRER